MAISSVGGPSPNTGTGVNTLSFTSASVGDLLVLSFSATENANNAAVSGGGVTAWTNATSYLDTQFNIYMSLWTGIVSSSGTATISVAGSYGSGFNTLWAEEFTESAGGRTWILGTPSSSPGSSGVALSSGTNVSYPVLTPSGATDYLYLGFGFAVFGDMNSGSTAGYTYGSTGSNARQVIYNAAASGTQSPTATQTNTGAYDSIAVIIGSGNPNHSGLLMSGIP
jgi:hypothetical protein